MTEHDRELSRAFDARALRFEQVPAQSNPAALGRLLQLADLPSGGLVLDAGCGPGLVSEALLQAGYRVVGVDLSGEAITLARKRCGRFGAHASFEQKSLFDESLASPFDASIGRFVLHHTPDPLRFIRRQVELLRLGGVLLACDYTTDPDPVRAEWHQEIERERDRTHTRNLTPGEMVDLLAAAGLIDLRLSEESYVFDFDVWFDSAASSGDKEAARRRLLSGASARGFCPLPRDDGRVRIEGCIALVRGVKPPHE